MDAAQDDSNKLLGRLGWLWISFQAFAVVLAYAIPESLYPNSAPVRAFADAIASIFGSIGQFAAYSRFPGTTRVVLATLLICLPLLAFLQWRVPGYVLWRPEVHAKSRFVVWVFPLLVLGLLSLPFLLEIDSEASRVIRAMTKSKFALGFVAGTYCVVAAWFLALMPRTLRFLFQAR